MMWLLPGFVVPTRNCTSGPPLPINNSLRWPWRHSRHCGRLTRNSPNLRSMLIGRADVVAMTFAQSYGRDRKSIYAELAAGEREEGPLRNAQGDPRDFLISMAMAKRCATIVLRTSLGA